MSDVPAGQAPPGGLTDAERLASRLAERLCEYVWDQGALSLDGRLWEVVGSDELDGMDDDEVVLRGPDGRLWDVEIDVYATERTRGV